MTIIYMILLIKVLCILYAPMGAFLDGNDLQIVLVIGEYTKLLNSSILLIYSNSNT